MYSPENQSKDSLYRDGRIYDLMHEKLVADTNYFVEEAARIVGSRFFRVAGFAKISM